MQIELEKSDIEKIAEQITEKLKGQLAPSVALLTAEQLANHLNVPKSWIYERTRDNSIPHIKIGKYVRFSLPEVLAWIKTNNNKNNC
jgi:excisionase family DNA binding protein